ncbi:MAG: GNAT family N-acetyltransferase [Bacteroidota bacterium]
MTNKEIYEKFCEREKDLPIFSQPWYLDVVCGKKGWEVLIVKKGTEVAATMPYQLKKKLGFRLARMPKLTGYLGPYFPKKFRKQREKLMRALLAQLPKVSFFEQNFHPSLTNALPLHWEKFMTLVRYTFIIDLEQSLEEIYQNISPNYRNNKIKKAQRRISVTEDEPLEICYALQEKTFARQNLKTPYTFDFLEKYDELLKEKASRKIFFAKDQAGNVHAALYLIWDETTAYLHMLGNDPVFRKSGAGILLIWYAIQFAKELLQKKQFDFEGSMIEPITKVRRDFGATQTPYFHVLRYHSKMIEILHQLK